MEEVINPGLVLIQLHSGSESHEFRVTLLQIGQRGARIFEPLELSKPGNDVGQSSYVIIVERPRPPPDLNRLGIML
jgi:hypothetical protein